jgi:quinol monooxygenase YgiN
MDLAWQLPLPENGPMRHARVGTLGTKPGRRDELVALLTRRGEQLAAIGCLLYEVGVNAEQPDTVFVVELWESESAHRASLALDTVQSGIAEAMPLLSGQMGSQHFEVVGSPLRD